MSSDSNVPRTEKSALHYPYQHATEVTLPSSANDLPALRSAKIIISAVASQTQIIEDLLDLSRVNMGRISLDPAMFDLGELTREMGAAPILVQNDTTCLQGPATTSGVLDAVAASSL
jgi:hypothetical protein